MDGFDHEIERTMAMGRRNAELIELARRHCARIRVAPSPLGGVSMVEQQTGLPISMREFHCEHAAKSGGAASNLEFIALKFYEQNCLGCQHRELGSVPNLATMAEEIAAERRADEEREVRTHRDAESVRMRRRQERQQRVKDEPQPTRDLIARINLLDAEEEPVGAGEELAALVRGAPQIVTQVAADVLVEAAMTLHSEHVLEAVGHAAGFSRILVPQALETAAATLAKRPSSQAARILLRFRSAVTAAVLSPARKSLIQMAGRFLEPPFLRPDGQNERDELWVPAFELLADVDLAGVLLDLEGMLESDSDFDRERAGAAAEVLVALNPEVAPVLARQLVAAIGLSQETPFDDSMSRPSATLAAALTGCLLGDPAASQLAIEGGAGAFTDGQRERLFDAYDNVIRSPDKGQQVPAGIGGVVVEACVRHARGDWGPDAQRQAVDTLELTSEWHGYLLKGHAATLFSLLLEMLSWRPTMNGASKAPELAALEQMNARASHNYQVRKVREAIGGLARHLPQEVLDHVRAFLSDESLETDEAKEMRAECVRLLGDIGGSPAFMPAVLPLIYKAMVHADQVMRSVAIDALQEVSQANRQSMLPFEFSATLPALLADPYVIVHRQAARALAFGLPVREEHHPQVLAALFLLAEVYEKSGNDPDIMDDVVTALLRLGTAPLEKARAVRQIAASLAQHLKPSDKVRFLRFEAEHMLELPEYVTTLLDALCDPSIVLERYMDDEALRRLLHRVPPELLLPHVDELRAAALVDLPLRVGPAVGYVEVLQRLGLWTDAVMLAEEIVATLPDTAEGAVVRTLAEDVLACARLEEAIAEGRDLGAALQSWASAEAAHGQAMRDAAMELPWKS